MKLPAATSRAKKDRQRSSAGQILVEAVMGLSLIVFVWILVSYVSYMCNDRIRANMAARFSAWLSGNAVSAAANGATSASFFLNSNTNLVRVASTKNTMSLLGVSLPSIIVPDPYIYSNSVTFGTNKVSSSSPFPFNMLSVKVPFMPEMPTNFLVVEAHCAWPDVSDTYNGYAPPGIAALGVAEIGWTAGIFVQ